MQRIIFVCKLNLLFLILLRIFFKAAIYKKEKRRQNPFRCTFEPLKSNRKSKFSFNKSDLSRDCCPPYNSIINATLTLNSARIQKWESKMFSLCLFCLRKRIKEKEVWSFWMNSREIFWFRILCPWNYRKYFNLNFQ